MACLYRRVAFSWVDIDAITRNFQGPEEAGWRESGWIQIVDLGARTGLIDIHSDKAESSLMNLPVRAAECPAHKTHV